MVKEDSMEQEVRRHRRQVDLFSRPEGRRRGKMLQIVAVQSKYRACIIIRE